MRKKKIYIVCRKSRAAQYGIGTYRAQLYECLRMAGIEFGVIELSSELDDIVVERKNGYEQISVPMPGMGPGVAVGRGDKYCSRNAAYLLREIIPDDPHRDIVFHINLMNDDVLVGYLKKLFDCKIVLTIHYTNWSFDLLGNTRKLDQMLAKRKNAIQGYDRKIRRDFDMDVKMAQKCDHVVYIADHSASTLSKYIKAKRKTIVNNGLKDEYVELTPEEKRRLREKYHIDPESKVLVFAGRLDEVKGIQYLVKAFRKLLPEFPDSLLVVAGEGDFSYLLKETTDIWSKIAFTGKVDKKKLYELYRIADVGVVCSLHEEFGYVAAEMMMHGLAVVVSDTGGLAEIVEEDISGLKVRLAIRKGQRSLNTNLLASKIGLILNDDDLAARLGKGARERFLEKYELSVFVRNMISVYERL